MRRAPSQWLSSTMTFILTLRFVARSASLASARSFSLVPTETIVRLDQEDSRGHRVGTSLAQLVVPHFGAGAISVPRYFESDQSVARQLPQMIQVVNKSIELIFLTRLQRYLI